MKKIIAIIISLVFLGSAFLSHAMGSTDIPNRIVFKNPYLWEDEGGNFGADGNFRQAVLQRQQNRNQVQLYPSLGLQYKNMILNDKKNIVFEWKPITSPYNKKSVTKNTMHIRQKESPVFYSPLVTYALWPLQMLADMGQYYKPSYDNNIFTGIHDLAQ